MRDDGYDYAQADALWDALCERRARRQALHPVHPMDPEVSWSIREVEDEPETEELEA
jgi:hypothetical protein